MSQESISTAQAANALRGVASTIAQSQARVAAVAASVRTRAAAADAATRAQIAATAINSAGIAVSEHSITGTGLGTQDVATPITFSVPFRTVPTFASGVGIVNKAAGSITPRGSVTVTRWIQDDNGNFTGAYLSLWIGPDTALVKKTTTTDDAGNSSTVVVDGTTALKAGSFKLQFLMSFTGLAYKNLNDDVMTAMDSIMVKSTLIGGTSG